MSICECILMCGLLVGVHTCVSMPGVYISTFPYQGSGRRESRAGLSREVYALGGVEPCQVVISAEADMHSRVPPTHLVTLNGSKRELSLWGHPTYFRTHVSRPATSLDFLDDQTHSCMVTGR